LNAETGTALVGFNQEAVVYYQAISGADAHRYAMDYAKNSPESGEEMQTAPLPRMPILRNP